jgi:hypothetical protein
VAAALLALTLSGSEAWAQSPGLTPSTGHLPAHHAVPPGPELFRTPLPGLPPPSRNAPVEATLGFQLIATTFTTRVGPDGSIDFGEGRAGFWAGGDPVAGLVALIQFDGDAWAGNDPYLPEKLKVMEATRAERWEMRRAHDVMVMQRALDDLPRYLDAVWSRPGWSASTRRELLFALWDEAAEDGNELLRQGGAEARRIIEQYVAWRLPPGSRHAFGGAELARLNRARQSRQAFAPYDRKAPERREEDGSDAPAPMVADSELLLAALRTF